MTSTSYSTMVHLMNKKRMKIMRQQRFRIIMRRRLSERENSLRRESLFVQKTSLLLTEIVCSRITLNIHQFDGIKVSFQMKRVIRNDPSICKTFCLSMKQLFNGKSSRRSIFFFFCCTQLYIKCGKAWFKRRDGSSIFFTWSLLCLIDLTNVQVHIYTYEHIEDEGVRGSVRRPNGGAEAN